MEVQCHILAQMVSQLKDEGDPLVSEGGEEDVKILEGEEISQLSTRGHPHPGFLRPLHRRPRDHFHYITAFRLQHLSLQGRSQCPQAHQCSEIVLSARYS